LVLAVLPLKPVGAWLIAMLIVVARFSSAPSDAGVSAVPPADPQALSMSAPMDSAASVIVRLLRIR
jgi:hypothetical protein